MGGSSKQPTTTTTVNKTEPDPISQAFRQDMMARGQRLLDQGPAPFYPGQTVADFSPDTMAGLDMTRQVAMQGSPGAGLGYLSAARMMGGPRWGMDTAQSAADGGMNNPMAGQFAAAGAQQNPFASLFQPMASGAEVGANPFLRGMVDRGMNDIQNNVGAAFSRAGRYGSGAHAGVLAEKSGDFANQMYGSQYQFDRGQQMQAMGQLAGLGESALGRRMQGLGAEADLFAQDRARQMQGVDALRGLQGDQTRDAGLGLNMLQQLRDYQLQPADLMFRTGGMMEDHRQRQIDADRERYDYEANAPWMNLGRYSNLVAGLPSGSTSTGTTTMPKPRTSPLLGALSGASGGLGLAGALGASGPIGWGIAGLGALAGAFG